MFHLILLYDVGQVMVPLCTSVDLFMQRTSSIGTLKYFRHLLTRWFWSADYDEEENHFCILFPWRTGYATEAV